MGSGVGLADADGVAVTEGMATGGPTDTLGPSVWPSNEGTGNDSAVWPAIAIVMNSCQIAAGIVPP